MTHCAPAELYSAEESQILDDMMTERKYFSITMPGGISFFDETPRDVKLEVRLLDEVHLPPSFFMRASVPCTSLALLWVPKFTNGAVIEVLRMLARSFSRYVHQA